MASVMKLLERVTPFGIMRLTIAPLKHDPEKLHDFSNKIVRRNNALEQDSDSISGNLAPGLFSLPSMAAMSRSGIAYSAQTLGDGSGDGRR
jgi:hypothetical protein